MTAYVPAGIFTMLGWILKSIGLSVSDELPELSDKEDSFRISDGLLTALDACMKLNSISKSCSLIFLNGMRNFCIPPIFFNAIGITYSYIALC